MNFLRPQSSRLFTLILTASVGFIGSAVEAQTGPHRIAAAHLNVIQNDAANTTNSVTLTTALSINDLRIRPGSNRGDYNVQVGTEGTDDLSVGVMITSVAENGRDNGEIAYPGPTYCTTAINYHRTGSEAGSFYIPVFHAPEGDEYNVDVAAAFFPYTNWLGGLVRNSAGTDNGTNNLLTASPGILLGTNFVDHGNGVSTVNLTNRGIDARTDGVLLVAHANNENNYALSKVNSNGTWSVYIKDNGTDVDVYEQGPVAFVYIPRTNTTVISGRFSADGTPLIYSGATPQFNVTNVGAGTWELTLTGHTPASGVLIVSPEGGESFNRDNIVSYRANASGWTIQSRDLPGNPPALQTPDTQPVASFVFVPVTAQVSLIAPTNGATRQSIQPTLQVAVSNSAPANMTVQFFGREVAKAGADFTIIGLPDTQYYTSSRNGGTPQMFYAQSEWIITNRVSRNIAYVAHFGDITDDGDLLSNGNSNITQWRNSTNAMYRLESPSRTTLPFGIPYGIAVGNHDQEPNGSADGGSAFYNQFFGISHFQGRPYYGGQYGTNNDNHFDLFSVSGLDFVVLYFEFDSSADPDVLAWGNQVLQTNAHRRAIVVTHNLGNTATPVNFSAQGAAIYQALKGNTNLFMMLAGHVTGQGSRVDTFNGNTVRTFVSDYQGWTNGGNGYLRIMEFSPRNNQVVFQTYSPYLDEYETGPTSELFFPYDMQSPSFSNDLAFTLIGTVSNVAPGAVASLVWSNRVHGREYEWYAVVTDGLNNIGRGPIWRFSTSTNTPPSVSSQLLNILGDFPTNLVLTASDADGDSLTFQTNTWPASGVNLSFNASAGTVTYQPAHGFRGLDQFFFSVSDGVFSNGPALMRLNVVSPPDTNSNGLPDYWELKHGVSDPNADSDGDGRNNRDEYKANTNPTNAASVLHITEASRASNGPVHLSWSAVGGTRYRLQYSNGGTNGHFNGAFTDLVRPLTNEMGFTAKDIPYLQTFVDDFTSTGGTLTNAARYYRIKVVQ